MKSLWVSAWALLLLLPLSAAAAPAASAAGGLQGGEWNFNSTIKLQSGPQAGQTDYRSSSACLGAEPGVATGLVGGVQAMGRCTPSGFTVGQTGVKGTLECSYTAGGRTDHVVQHYEIVPAADGQHFTSHSELQQALGNAQPVTSVVDVEAVRTGACTH
ncbi:MAG TPA: hypothetical protein VFQ88_05910 [Nevskiaceae bacterium]|nr:hypothetical protein [Nevskiaceae bacterium]